MAIVYNKVARRNLQKPNEPAKWYLCNKSIGTVIAMVVSFVVCYVLYGVWKKQGKLEEGE